jgi:hypothetical protein
MSVNIRMRLDDYLTLAVADGPQHDDTRLCCEAAVGTNGRAFILDSTGKMVVSSAPDGDPVVEVCGSGPAPVRRDRRKRPSCSSITSRRSRFAANVADLRDHVSRRQRRPSLDSGHGHARSVLSGGLARANSRSAMVFAVALVLPRAGCTLASMVTAPLRRRQTRHG